MRSAAVRFGGGRKLDKLCAARRTITLVNSFGIFAAKRVPPNAQSAAVRWQPDAGERAKEASSKGLKCDEHRGTPCGACN